MTAPAYTVAAREKGRRGPFLFIGSDLCIQETMQGCKPLSCDEAMEAADLLIAGAKRERRAVEYRIVPLPR